MTKHTYFRGHPIEQNARHVWIFADTGEAVAGTWSTRPCGVCGQFNTPEGHDACLGTIPGAVNACCGHGYPHRAYVQYPDGTILRGQDMWDHLKMRPVAREAG